MRSVRFTIAAFVLAALTIISAQAQTRPAASPQPAAGGGAAPTSRPFAVIDSSAFSDDKAGITRVVNALKQIETQFQPQRTELQGLQTQYDNLVNKIKSTQAVANQQEIAKLQDQAEQLQTQIKRKQEDAQASYQKRVGEVLDPLQQDVGNALTAYAQARGIAIIIDVSRVPVIYAADSVDITKDFIAEYNRTHPATAAAVPANHPE
jgi:outer membrane protein